MRSKVASLDGDALHHTQLSSVAGNEVQEGQLFEALGLLVSKFDHLMVSLLQCLFTQTLPDILLFDNASLFKGDGQVAAFDGKIEPSHGVLYEMQSDLGVTLLLKITDNALANQVRGSDDLKNFIVVLLDERELESVLCRIDGDGPWLCLSVQAVHGGALDSSQVDGLFERLDNTVVTIIIQRGERILLVQRAETAHP